MEKLKKYKWGILISVCILAIAILVISIVVVSNAVETTKTASNEESIVEVAAQLARGVDASSKVTQAQLQSQVDRIRGGGRTPVTTISGENALQVKFNDSGRTYKVDINTGTIIKPGDATWVTVGEIFDQAGSNANGLHIGDFVNYNAGTWTAAQISAIKVGPNNGLVAASGVASQPTTNFQFGGFAAGTSRNATAPIGNATYTGKIDGGKVIAGWRLFDVVNNQAILISAGFPEDYFTPTQSYADSKGMSTSFVTEYILSGNINTAWDQKATAATTYTKRNWKDYVNTAQGAISATALTKTRLNSWFSKYIGGGDSWATATFQKLYSATYQKYMNIIDVYAYYWLGSAEPDMNNSSIWSHYVDPKNKWVGQDAGWSGGVRILVTLDTGALFSSARTGTKTLSGGNLTANGGNKTYNIWGMP